MAEGLCLIRSNYLATGKHLFIGGDTLEENKAVIKSVRNSRGYRGTLWCVETNRGGNRNVGGGRHASSYARRIRRIKKKEIRRMSNKAKSGSVGEVDMKGVIRGRIEGDAEEINHMGKGKNVGKGSRVEVDGKGGWKHHEVGLLISDNAAAVGLQGEGGGSRTDVANKVGVTEDGVRRVAVQ